MHNCFLASTSILLLSAFISSTANAATLRDSNITPIYLSGINFVDPFPENPTIEDLRYPSDLVNDTLIHINTDGILKLKYQANIRISETGSLINFGEIYTERAPSYPYITSSGSISNFGLFENHKHVSNDSLFISNHTHLKNSSEAEITAQLLNKGMFINEGDFEHVTPGYGRDLENIGGQIINSGHITVTSEIVETGLGFFNNSANASVWNKTLGQITVEGFSNHLDSIINNDGEIESRISNNEGQINNNGTLKNGEYFSNQDNAALVNSGSIINNDIIFNSGLFVSKIGSSINGSGSFSTTGRTIVDGVLTQSSLTVHKGTLSGNGIINSNVSIQTHYTGESGHIAPGNSIGTLTINGDYVQSIGGFMDIEFNNSAIDSLKINGTAFLAGILNFDFIGSELMKGKYTFLEFNNLEGQFTSTQLPSIEGYNLKVIYDTNSASLLVSAVPEPATWLMFSAGLLGMLSISLRRNNIT